MSEWRIVFDLLGGFAVLIVSMAAMTLGGGIVWLFSDGATVKKLARRAVAFCRNALHFAVGCVACVITIVGIGVWWVAGELREPHS